MEGVEGSLFEQYSKNNPLFVKAIESFSNLDRSRLLKGFVKEADKSNFRSKLSELRFGCAFEEVKLNPRFEKKFSTFKPDWTCQLGASIGLFEVYRLNKSFKDDKITEIQSLLFEEIEKIKSNIYLEINLINLFEFDHSFTLDFVILQITRWLKAKSRALYESLNICNKIKIVIVRIDTSSDHVLCCTGPQLIDQKPEKLGQKKEFSPNEITKKLFKYNAAIDLNPVPYFLCVEIDFLSGFHYSDFVEHFWYSGAEFQDYEGRGESWKNGVSWSVLGRFYESEVKRHLSGIIVLDNKEFRLLLNPFKKQIIYSENYKTFLNRLESINGMKAIF